MEAGGIIPEHRSAGRISVEAVLGHLRMRAGGRSFDLPAGRLVVIDGAIPHEIIAIEDSAFLLTIALPGMAAAGAAAAK